jgi:hypothetical protein
MKLPVDLVGLELLLSLMMAMTTLTVVAQSKKSILFYCVHF